MSTEILEAFAQTAVRLNLNEQEQNQMLAAVKNALTKSYLSAEEIGELTEVFPKFRETLASALGLDQQQLSLAIQSKQLPATDALLKTAQAYQVRSV